ncbi:MAG: hypothetical protein ACOVKO_00525 [Elstera sp.]
MAQKMVYISPADAACCAKDTHASATATVFAKAVRLLATPILALSQANQAARLRRQANEIPDHLRHDIGLDDVKGPRPLRENHNVRFPDWT